MLAATSTIFASCSSPVGTAAPPTFRPDQFTLATDRTSYAPAYLGGTGAYAEYGFNVIARFTNHAEATVYLARCDPRTPYPMYGVATVGETDASAYDPTWACVGHAYQFAVAPGATRVDTLRVIGPSGVQGDHPLGTFTGNMRLVYEVQSCRGDALCRIEGAGNSNVFVVGWRP